MVLKFDDNNFFFARGHIHEQLAQCFIMLCNASIPNQNSRLLGVEDTGYVTVEHRLTNLWFPLFSSFFWSVVLHCFTSAVSSTPSKIKLLHVLPLPDNVPYNNSQLCSRSAKLAAFLYIQWASGKITSFRGGFMVQASVFSHYARQYMHCCEKDPDLSSNYATFPNRFFF